MIRIQFIFILLFCYSISYSQERIIDTTFFETVDTVSGFYTMKPNATITKEAVISKIMSFNGLNSNSSFVEYKSKVDLNRNTHVKFQHYYYGIPVYGSQLYLHSDSSAIVKSANGFVASDFDNNVSVGTSSTEAIANAIASTTSELFMWQDSSYENSLKRDKNDITASYYPSADLLFYRSTNSTKYVPVYRVLINSLIPEKKEYVFVSANDGSILNRSSILETCTAPHTPKNREPQAALSSCSGDCIGGTTKTIFYGNQNINIGKHNFSGDCKHRLVDHCNNTFIHTKSKIAISSNSGSSPDFEYTDQTTFFNFNPTTPGGTAHWCAEMATEYYRNVFGREGMNGLGTGSSPFFFNIWCNSNSLGNDNAFYDPSTDDLNFGSGFTSISNNAIIALDIVGHEYTHGVSHSEADFDQFGEPGALNESFSDIFGKMIEYYAKSIHSTGTNFSYDYGSEPYNHTPFTLDNSSQQIYPDRDMSYPNNSLMPDTYQGLYWVSTGNTNVDKGGKHENATVQDYWFYLLAEGGSGTNDNNDNYCVIGIGKDKATRIAYQNLTTYMSTYSNFAAARAGAIQSAIDLYGANSNEVAQVTAAWYAVGVGTQYSGQINISNQTINSSYSSHYNSKIQIQNVMELQEKSGQI